MINYSGLRCVFVLRLYKSEKCFGPGIVQLLELIQETSSLRSAAASIHIAYSKAWRIIKTAEKELGVKLLNSVVGGVDGGGMTLTNEALDILKRYKAFSAEAKSAINGIFKKNFLSDGE